MTCPLPSKPVHCTCTYAMHEINMPMAIATVRADGRTLRVVYLTLFVMLHIFYKRLDVKS
jgi:hypothetical protein